MSTSFTCMPSSVHVLECSASVNGGAPKYTYHWNVSPSTGRTISFYCGLDGGSTTVHVVETVTDSTGATASADKMATCDAGTTG